MSGREQVQQNTRAVAGLLDHLFGAGEYRRWHREAQRFGCLEIDRKLELGRLLHRHVGRLSASQNATDVVTGLTKSHTKICSITREPTGCNIFTGIIDCWHSIMRGQSGELITSALEGRVWNQQQCVNP